MIVPPNMGHGSDSALSPALLSILPKDPYDQLDVARKITSMAVSSRVGILEAEANSLRQKLADREMTVSTLQGHVSELQHELQQASTRLSSVLEEQEKLAAEKASLEASVKKLNRDVAKLETFKKALMHSLQDEDESPASSIQEQRSTNTTPVVTSPAPFVAPEPEAKSRSTTPQIFPLTPSNLTPSLSPSRSPRRHSASNSPKSRSIAVSPTKRQPVKGSSAATSPLKSRTKSSSSNKEPSKVSSKWHSVSDGRLSLPSSLPTSKHATAPNSPPHIARTARVDGKEFFRQARNRLSYEQFSAFLANIKELNAHHQTREETLKKASEIFGSENADLYEAFDGLLSRHLPGES
ncbi:hypothetical protein GOP47_0026679 [Adiantum capillus-veneris]|nr:hypothetical protein GOP47_0026679 [Adiantum capillus-veneris]